MRLRPWNYNQATVYCRNFYSSVTEMKDMTNDCIILPPLTTVSRFLTARWRWTVPGWQQLDWRLVPWLRLRRNLCLNSKYPLAGLSSRDTPCKNLTRSKESSPRPNPRRTEAAQCKRIPASPQITLHKQGVPIHDNSWDCWGVCCFRHGDFHPEIFRIPISSHLQRC